MIASVSAQQASVTLVASSSQFWKKAPPKRAVCTRSP